MKLRGGLTQILLPADCEFPEDPEALASVFDGCDSLIAIYAPGPAARRNSRRRPIFRSYPRRGKAGSEAVSAYPTAGSAGGPPFPAEPGREGL